MPKSGGAKAPNSKLKRAAVAKGLSKNVAAGFQQQASIDGLARPKLLFVIGKHCLEANGPAGLIDRIVDEQKRPGAQRAAVVLVVGGHLDRTTRHGPAHIAKDACRQGEKDGLRPRQHQRRD